MFKTIENDTTYLTYQEHIIKSIANYKECFQNLKSCKCYKTCKINVVKFLYM